MCYQHNATLNNRIAQLEQQLEASQNITRALSEELLDCQKRLDEALCIAGAFRDQLNHNSAGKNEF